MQVFVTYHDVYLVAERLDRRRLNKQVIECKQIIKAICGESSAWKNHPVVKMYKESVMWLTLYAMTLEAYRKGKIKESKHYSLLASKHEPSFIIPELIFQHRYRLFEKDPLYYDYWWYTRGYARQNMNLYIVDKMKLWYENGKLVDVSPIGVFGENINFQYLI